MQINTILRTILVWGICMVPFIPLVVSTSMFFPFITGKNFFFRFLVEILFGVWLILLARDAYYRPKFSWILVAVSSFVGIVALADLFGENLARSFWSNYERMEGFVSLLHLFAYFLIALSVMRTEEAWKRFFHISIGVSVFLVFYGILQMAGELVINQGGVRLDGTLGNATYLAVYMLFHIFFSAFYLLRASHLKIFTGDIFLSGFIGFGLFMVWAFVRAGNAAVTLGFYEKVLLFVSVAALGCLSYLYVKHKEKAIFQQIFYGIVILSQLVILYYTATRGAILGLVGGVFVTLGLTFFFSRKDLYVRRFAIGLTIAFLLLVGGIFALKNTAFIQGNPALSRISNISLNDAESRFLIWKMSLKGFKENPILGWGQENFSLVFNKYYDPKMYKQEPWFDRAHNVLFDWLIAAGLLGLLAYGSIFAALLYYLLLGKENSAPEHTLAEEKKKKKGDKKEISGGFLFTPIGKSIFVGLLAGYAFQNLFVFDQLISYIFFFSVLSFVHVATRSDDTNVEEKKLPKERNLTLEYAAISVAIILTPFLVYGFNAKGYLANRDLLQAIAPQEEGSDKNLEYFKEALAHNSFGTTEIREQLSQFAINAAESKITQEKKSEIFLLARDEIKKQTEEVPNDARYRLFGALVFLAYGLLDEAIVELEEGIRISPQKQTLHYTLANPYLLKGDIQKAFEITKSAFDAESSNEEARRYYAAAAIFAGEDALAEDLLTYYGGNLPVDPIFIRAYIARGQFARLVSIWEKRVQTEPGNTQYRISLAAAYLEVNENEKAIRELEEAIRITPEFKEQGEYFISEIRAGRKP